MAPRAETVGWSHEEEDRESATGFGNIGSLVVT